MLHADRPFIEQVQKLNVSPGLVQDMKMLQLNTISLNEYIKEQVQDNPILEYEYMPLGTSYSQYDSAAGISTIPDESSMTMEDYLLFQLSSMKLPSGQNAAVSALISSVNSDGYLMMDLSRIAEESGMDLSLLESALTILHSMDPPGIGARSLTECLELQLRAMDRLQETEKAILENHLEDIADGNFEKIALALNLSGEKVKELVRLIQSLNPLPGSDFQIETTEYVVPDLLYAIDEEGPHLALNDSLMPSLRINSYYESLRRDSSMSREDASYIQANLNTAKNLIRAIAYRNRTIISVAGFIVKYQEAFFIHGEKQLLPLTYQEISDALDIHVSTVGRAVQEKYIETPMGTYPLKFFFPSAVSGNCSSTSIKIRMMEIIKTEDPQKPHSDQSISDLLSEQGYSVSRRTIAKYRDSLQIPSSTKRKKIHKAKACRNR